MKQTFKLFLIMLKIGLFTFGGGYAMIPLLENEFVEKHKWIEHEEFMDMLAIAESSPGPIAINCSTYIGYKLGKFWGSLLATIGVCIPSFVIIFFVSLFFNKFLEIEIVANAFKGIQVCVIFLIMSAGIKMLKNIEKKPLYFIIFAVVITLSVTFSLLEIGFSSIFYILASAMLGLFIYIISRIKSSETNSKEVNNDDLS